MHPPFTQTKYISLDLLTSEVHWHSYKISRKESPLSTQTFITKWLSEDTATGRVMVRRRQRQYSFCPRCQAPDEHLLHILTCPHASTRDLHSNIIQNLHQWLSKAKTHPGITSFFTLGPTQWFRHQSSN